MQRSTSTLVAMILVAVGCDGQVDPGGAKDPGAQAPGTIEKSEYAAYNEDVLPNGRGVGLRGQADKGQFGRPGSVVPITYHNNGPVILGTTNVYYIWYGNWSGNTAIAILNNLASSIGGSSYFNINTTYYSSVSGSPKTAVSNSVYFAGSTTDNYSRGTSLSDTAIGNVVGDAITSGRLPSDSNGVYFVLTSADVTASSGFCTKYCGWHTYGTLGGTAIKFAFIGNPARCPNSCAWQTTTSPNDNIGADGMASIIAHELQEAVTDPLLNAWYDRNGAENADKCAWTFGTQATAANGSKYNVTLGGRQYLIQQNWVQVPNAGSCAMSY